MWTNELQVEDHSEERPEMERRAIAARRETDEMDCMRSRLNTSDEAPRSFERTRKPRSLCELSLWPTSNPSRDASPFASLPPALLVSLFFDKMLAQLALLVAKAFAALLGSFTLLVTLNVLKQLVRFLDESKTRGPSPRFFQSLPLLTI